MAEKRMFSKTIIDSDAFLDMPLSTQALYFHLSMRADDDGFVNNPKKIQRMVGACDDDCKLLLVKRFILAFENGVIVIKHWRLHNTLRKDRYKPTLYQDELSTLRLKDDGAYTDNPAEGGSQMVAKRLPCGDQLGVNQVNSINDEILSNDQSACENTTNINEMGICNKNGNQMATTWQPSIDKNRLVEKNITTNVVIQENEKPKKSIRSKKADIEKPQDVSEQVWTDFKQLRKQKKAPITLTVISRIRKEAEKAGITLDDALSTCCMRGWQGFNASWLHEDEKSVSKPMPRSKSSLQLHEPWNDPNYYSDYGQSGVLA